MGTLHRRAPPARRPHGTVPTSDVPSESRAYCRAEREGSLRDRRWEIYRRDPRVDALVAREAAADTIYYAYKAYAARQAWWRSDAFAILSRPHVTPSWTAEDGLLVPVFENSDDERIWRERDELVWQLQTSGGVLPKPGACAMHALDPCLDPPLLDQREDRS